MTDETLNGKVAIVSGSVGGGIGTAIAIELSARGVHVVLNYLPSLAVQVQETLSKLATPGIAVGADLSTVEGPQILVDGAVRAYGHVDILVNNASLAENKPLEEHTIEDWDRMVSLNGRGYFLLTKLVLPHLTTKDGRIINIGSVSSRNPPPFQTLYAGTKGMQECFTRVWAQELPPKYHCTVNSVSPGPTKTPAWQTVGEQEFAVLKQYIDRTPVEKRFGEPQDVAWAVAQLCEPRAGWVNGTNLFVTGGLYVD